MQQRRVGRSGLSVSALGLGTLTWGTAVYHDTAGDLLTAFHAAGGTLVDTAPTYGDGLAELWLGELVTGTVPRADLVIVSKAGLHWHTGERRVDTSRRGMLGSLDASLQRLRTDYVDVWLAHVWDPQVPLAETLGALEYAVQSGRARYVGVSNYRAWQTARAYSLLEQARIPLMVNEIEHSLVERGMDDVLAAGLDLGFGVFGWAPLGRGVLTGKYRHGIPADSRAASTNFPGFQSRFLTDRRRGLVEAVHTAARGLDVPAAAVALAWARDREGMSAVLSGPRTLGHLQGAIEADSLSLPGEVRAALDDVSRG